MTTLSDALNSKVGLISFPSVNAKIVANTLLYTVPAGKKLYLIAVIASDTSSSGITDGPTGGLGKSPGVNDIAAEEHMAALTSPPETFSFPLTGMSCFLAGGDSIYSNISVGATGTSETVSYYIIGVQF